MPKQLDKLLQQLITLHPKYIDLSLNRLLELLQKIDNPHLKLPPIIHIAGTNGKGSTLSYLRHIMMENKFLVHAYISPHLKSFNERIILANKEVVTSKLLKNLANFSIKALSCIFVSRCSFSQPIVNFIC